jgi:hypothetical protein
MEASIWDLARRSLLIVKCGGRYIRKGIPNDLPMVIVEIREPGDGYEIVAYIEGTSIRRMMTFNHLVTEYDALLGEPEPEFTDADPCSKEDGNKK